MRHSCLLFLCIVIYIVSKVAGSYDAGYGVPEVHGHGHSHGHSAGSYYHYHVPVVGQQQQHYHPPHHEHSSNELHYILPLLLLLFALPLLLLSLLPLLLLPIGLSLLALLAPGGMMMMMMMMEMMEMMSPARVRAVPLRKSGEAMRSFEMEVMKDFTNLASNFTRSVDLDNCPERLACELGAVLSPADTSTVLPTEKIMNYIIDKVLPKGSTRRNFRNYRNAYMKGSNSSKTCSAYNCQVKLHSTESPPKSGNYVSVGSDRAVSNNI